MKGSIFSNYSYSYLFFVVISSFMFFMIHDNFFLVDDLRWIDCGSRLSQDIKNILKPTSYWGYWGYFRPTISFFFFLNYSLFKLNPAGYYFFNLFFYTLNSILVYFILCEVLKKNTCYYKEYSFLASFLFLISTSHQEVVFWISCCVDTISTFFFLMSINIFIKYANTQRFFYYYILFFFYFLALLSKESTVVLPLILLTINYLILQPEKNFKNSFAKIIPLLVVGILYSVFYLFSFYHEIAKDQRPYNMGYHTFIQLAKLFYVFPISLYGVFENPLFLIPKIKHLNNSFFILIIMCIIVSFAFLKKNMYRIACFSILWIFFTFLPYLFVQRDIIHSGQRYLYLPSVGFSLFVIILFSSLYERGKNLIVKSFISILLLSIFSLNMLSYYKGEKFFDSYGERRKKIFLQVERISNKHKNASLISILNFIGTINLQIYQVDMLIWLNLKGINNVMFTSENELLNLKKNKSIREIKVLDMKNKPKSYKIENVVFIKWEKGNFIDETFLWRKFLYLSL